MRWTLLLRQQDGVWAWPRWMLSQALATGRSIVLAPFRVEAEDIAALPALRREERRRAAFLRLILVCVLVLDLLILLPATILGQAGILSLFRLALVTLLAAVGLFLNAHGRTMQAGFLFIAGTLGLVVDFLVTNPDGLDLQVLLTTALFAVVILIAGLILPGWATWLIAAIIIAITLACVFLLPLAPPLRALESSAAQLRFAVAGPLVMLHVFVAVFSWVAARSDEAIVQAVSRALAREHELSLLKEQFITNVNHELRTPLMALHGYVKLLRLRHHALAPERRGELIEKASRAGDDLVALVTSILEIQQFDQAAEQFVPEAINVRESVASAVRLVGSHEHSSHMETLTERNLEINIPEELTAWGEPVRLRQIMTNLLSNAMKYSAAGTPIEVTAWGVPAGADPPLRRRDGVRWLSPTLEITVRDYGHGIPPAQIPLLFERFVRLPRDLASNVAGNGLGLYLCRTLAESMQGRVWVESTGIESEGSIFHLRLLAPSDDGVKGES